MKSALPQTGVFPLDIIEGNYTKSEAGIFISQGTRHVFSANSEQKSKHFLAAQKGMLKRRIPRFSWERMFFARSIRLKTSQSRSQIIHKVTSDLGVEGKRKLCEKIQTVLEELITNAIYHANQLPDGIEKYERTDKVILEKDERITIQYAWQGEGIYLSVTDQGGKLEFKDLCNAFGRCYGEKDANQIETKTGGAGLGLYLVFEAMDHLKVVVSASGETKISCWISAQKTPEEFTFNFYGPEGDDR